jgi:hypothetical protein
MRIPYAHAHPETSLRAAFQGIATLLDRLLHHADVAVIEGASYRVRECDQEAAAPRRNK